MVAVSCVAAVVGVPGVVLAGLTVMVMVARVLVTMRRVMVCTAVTGMRAMVLSLLPTPGVLVVVVPVGRARAGMAGAFLGGR